MTLSILAVVCLADGPAWAWVTNQAVLAGATDTTTGTAFLPGTPQSFFYDADGNLTNDGRFVYTWDGENRLIQVETCPGTPTEARHLLTFQYDYLGRRIASLVYVWAGSNWSLAEPARMRNEPYYGLTPYSAIHRL
jgi:hypothetical protein